MLENVAAQAVDAAIAKAGSVAALAGMAKVKPQAVSQWRKQVPADKVLLVEALSGVSRHSLRSDVFGERAA